jgi:hypothetical protein
MCKNIAAAGGRCRGNQQVAAGSSKQQASGKSHFDSRIRVDYYARRNTIPL